MSRYIDQHRERFGVESICWVLGVSASAYYQRRTGQRSDRSLEDERLLEVIRVTHRRNYEAYGYRRMWKALLRAGEDAPRCQVQRLMAAHGIRGAKRRGKPWRTTKSDPAAQRPRDLVHRDFTAEAPNGPVGRDSTHLRCWEGVLYLAFIIDVFSRMVVGWQLAAHMRTTLVLDALRMALGLREPGADFQLVAHSDAGSQGRPMPSGSNSATDATGLQLHDDRSAGANRQSAAHGGTAAGVAKHQPASTFSGEQSVRQLSGGASRQTRRG